MREAVAASATELLRPLPPQESIPKVLERIGEAVGACRVQTYENVRQPDGRLAPTLRYEWSAPGVPPARDPQLPGATDHHLWDRDRLLPFLAAGKAKSLLRSDAPAPLRGALDRAGVVSLLLMPVSVDGEWWGQIGFGDCKRPRHWSAAHIDTLRTVAEMIGAALARARHLNDLSEANRVVENSPVVVYRLSAKPPYPLLYVSRNIERFGYAADELRAHPTRYVDLLHPEDRASVTSDIRRVASGETAELDREWRLRAAGGRYVWVNARARALYDAQHRVTEIEGILLDLDLGWVNHVMAFLAAANFVVSALHTVLILAG